MRFAPFNIFEILRHLYISFLDILFDIG